MANNRMPGNMLGLKMDGSFTTCEISCEFNFEAELIPASSLTSGQFREYVSGIKTWNVGVNAAMLVNAAGSTGLMKVLNFFYSGDSMGIVITTKLAPMLPSIIIAGKVRVKSGGFRSTVGSLADWNATLEGDGAFTFDSQINLLATDPSLLNLMSGGGNNLISK